METVDVIGLLIAIAMGITCILSMVDSWYDNKTTVVWSFNCLIWVIISTMYMLN